MRIWMLVTAVVLTPVAVWSIVHADDELRFSGGLGSGLSPAGRRASAVVVLAIAAIALAYAIAG